jgi:hypothetical protein
MYEPIATNAAFGAGVLQTSGAGDAELEGLVDGDALAPALADGLTAMTTGA